MAPWAGPAVPTGGAAAAPVSRGAIFGHVLWRVAVVCIGGGAAVGFLLIAVLLAFPDDGDGRAFSFLLVGPLFGGILGAMLAVVAAPIIAGVCAAALVPYPGRARCRLTVRLLGMGLVALFLLLALFDTSLDLGVLLLVGGIWAVSLAGAWFGSPWVIGWYVRSCETVTPTGPVVPFG